jgi:hypothetical protein
MSALIGLKVRPPAACTCGNEFAVISESDGRYPVTLKCACGRNRGAITQSTLDWLRAIAEKFGAPTTIVLRAVIPPVEVKS